MVVAHDLHMSEKGKERRGIRQVKFVKLLTVPAIALLSLILAVPAFAHEATIANLQSTCNSDHRVCFSFDVTTNDFDSTGRDVLVELFGPNSSTTPLETLTEHLAADTTSVHDCFKLDATNMTGLTIKIVKAHTTDDTDLSGTLTTDVDTSKCKASTPTPSTPTPTAPGTATPGGGGGAGTPTPTANTAVPLAQTGGFDYRFPLIGLALLVAGATLFVVSVSRGRSTNTK
jgi:hypothetical protein